MNEDLEKTANFFFPPDNSVNKMKFTHTRRLLKHPQQSNVSNPSTQITMSKPSSDNSGVEAQHTPPQIQGNRKRSEMHTRSDEHKPNNYRIFSSNLNQRSSYPQQISFGNQFVNDNEFLQLTDKLSHGALSPSKQVNKLPEIFHQRNSSSGFRQGFRIHSGNSKRDTMTNFKDLDCPRTKCLQQFQLKQPLLNQFKGTQNKLPNIGQAVPFLQTKQQMKIINRIFSGKRDY